MSGGHDKNDDGDEDETLAQFLTRTLDEAFIDNIPMDAIKELPTFYMYVMGAFAELATLGLFIYFVLQGYEQGISTKFISLDQASGACTDVVKSVSGNYMVDTQGIWVGNAGFDYSQAIYEMDWTDSAMTSTDYMDVMSIAKEQLMDLASTSSTLDLSMVALMYTAWQLICDPMLHTVCEVFKGQTFVFTADTSYMLSLTHIDVTLSNVYADCNSYSSSTYSIADSINQGNYQYDEFIVNPTCNTTANPAQFGYYPYLDGNNFHMEMDVRTMMDAMAVNDYILQLTGINQVYGFEYDVYTLNGYTYSGTYYIDAWYPGMHPMYCILNSLVGDAANVSTVNIDFSKGVLQMCFLQIGNQTGMPLFMHYGAGDNQPIPCDCSTPAGKSQNCNKFSFINGMAFFNNADMSLSDIVYTFLDIVIANGGALQWNKNAYNASWAAAASTYNDAESIINQTEWRYNAYQFCNSSVYGTCSIMAFNSYGDYVFDQALTPYMFLIEGGSCETSGVEQFMISESAFDIIVSNPPVEIIENYYECTMLPYDSMFNALGVAGGNIGIAVPIIVMCCLPFMYGWLKLTGNVQPAPEYEKHEKEAALDLLALQLLRIRDGRVRGMKAEGELQKIGKELVLAARKADGGYPDSDDSFSDDDDEENNKMGNRKGKPHEKPFTGADDVERDHSISSQSQEHRPSRHSVVVRRSSLGALKSAKTFLGDNTADSDDEDGTDERGEHSIMPSPQFDHGEHQQNSNRQQSDKSHRHSRRHSRLQLPSAASGAAAARGSENPLHGAADAPNNSRLTGMYEL